MGWLHRLKGSNIMCYDTWQAYQDMYYCMGYAATENLQEFTDLLRKTDKLVDILAIDLGSIIRFEPKNLTINNVRLLGDFIEFNPNEIDVDSLSQNIFNHVLTDIANGFTELKENDYVHMLEAMGIDNKELTYPDTTMDIVYNPIYKDNFLMYHRLLLKEMVNNIGRYIPYDSKRLTLDDVDTILEKHRPVDYPVDDVYLSNGWIITDIRYNTNDVIVTVLHFHD